MKNKFVSALIIFTLAFILIFQNTAAILAETSSDTLQIKSAEDLIKFSKKCRLDSWSRDKTVELSADIDLSEVDFAPIPTFGGTFLGNGHTISGIELTQKGSYLGMFRYLQSGGYIENLNVSGKLKPDGTKSYIGGIVGENSGTISNCTFTGSVEGEENIGGIAGYTTESGRIYGCIVYGTVTGKTYTGGITGQNFGHIELCENYGNINTIHIDKSRSLDDINIEDLDLSEPTLRSTEKIEANTDTGGVAGYNKGEIRACKNHGNVGYNHIGYNTGGIAGRQAGHISACENFGNIYGRKDVGGICGQAEPFVIMEFSKSTIRELDDILFDIQEIIDSALDNSDNSISSDLTAISNTLSDISSNARNMSDSAINYTENLNNAANDLSGRVHTALDKSDNALDELSRGGEKLESAVSDFDDMCRYLNDAIDELKIISDNLEDVPKNASNAARYFDNASNRLERAISEFEDSTSNLKGGIARLNASIKNLRAAIGKSSSAENSLRNEVIPDITNIRNSFGSMESALRDVQKALDLLSAQGNAGESLIPLAENLGALIENIQNIKNAFGDVIDELTDLADSYNSYSAAQSVNYLKRAFANMSSAFNSLKKIADDLDKVSGNTDNLTESGKLAIEKLRDGLSSLGEASGFLSNSAKMFSDIMEEATRGGKITIPEIDDNFKNNLDKFFDSADTMQEQFKNLNDKISSKKDSFTNDLRRINNRFLNITELLSDAYDDTVSDENNVIEDISDSDTNGDTRGKTELCINRGEVLGDINSGGIAGSMAIEYDFDPEDDILRSGEETLNFTYKTKSVIRRCENYGKVTTKNNYGGGIAGRMHLGSILFCENYGDVICEDGSYIGGIAGASDSIIRNSFVKCSIAGKNYVGGITGAGKTISRCCSLVNISAAEEFSGAVSGKNLDNNIHGCTFLNPDLGGIDGINYSGIAEECSIKHAADFLHNTFSKELEFNLTFVADGETVGTVPFTYGEEISEDLIPDVPEKEGCYGRWSEYDFDSPTFDAVIEANYYRAVDIIASPQKRDNNRSIALVVGTFDDKAEVDAVSAKNAEPKPRKKSRDEYHIKITDKARKKGDTAYKVRYLPKLTAKSADIYIGYGENLQKVKTTTVGSYLEFETSEKDFMIYEVKKTRWVIWLILSAAAILSAFAFLFIRKRKKTI